MQLLPKSRLEAFADGFFAIVITLLVLELPVPEVDKGLWSALVEEWPTFLAYLISFSFVGGIWIAHSDMTKLVKQANAILFRLNLVLLLFVATLPYTTKLMATHMSGDSARLSVVIYGVNLLIASIMLNIIMLYTAHHPDLVVDEVADEELKSMERHRRIAVWLGTAAVIIAIVVPPVGIVLYITQSIWYLVRPLLHIRKKGKKE